MFFPTLKVKKILNINFPHEIESFDININYFDSLNRC